MVVLTQTELTICVLVVAVIVTSLLMIVARLSRIESGMSQHGADGVDQEDSGHTGIAYALGSSLGKLSRTFRKTPQK